MSKFTTDERIGTIYKITNKINGKVYIGQTIMDVRDRWYRHCEIHGLSSGELKMPIKRAILKYGKDSFELSIIEKVPKELLDSREIYWINQYNSFKEGYNATVGGKSGERQSKISEDIAFKIKSLYLSGFSLREIGREFNIDKVTVKTVLNRLNIPLRKIRNYKYTSKERSKMIDLINKGETRKDICKIFGVSKSYLSQLCNGSRRI